MLALLLAAAALAAPLPVVDLAWRGGAGRLIVQAPPGEHLAPDAPLRGFLAQGEARTDWSLPTPSSPLALLAAVGPGPLAGQLRVSLCQDGGTTCRWAEVEFTGRVEGRRGRLALAVQPLAAAPPPAVVPDPASLFVGDPDAAVRDAQARAAATGARVLLDFAAAWCPPCNLMSAELLHDPDDHAALDGLLLVTIDADRADSWTLKDRYAVGGYPTLVATDAQGQELARRVGYDGEEALRAWLQAVRDGLDEAAPVGDAAAGDDPAAAAARALTLALQGRDASARQALAVALADPATQDLPTLRRARFLLDPTAADLTWLLAQDAADPTPLLTWLWEALPLAQADPALADGLRQALARVLPAATPVQAADLLFALGELQAPGPARQAWMGAAAAALRPALTGDLRRDRGHLTWLAELLAGSGDVDGAVALLGRAVATWPADFTFHHALASTLHEAGRDALALPPAQAALACAYGDNRLRAARGLALVLEALGRREEALAVVVEALERAERPAEGLDVRTPRYLAALEELRGRLQPAP